MERRDRYPIGQQDFKVLRQREAFYVDKTHYIKKILDADSQYLFLARPRRFGKSLFLSTLRYFFEGERELFKGLYIDTVQSIDWQPYPVLHIDFNGGEYDNPEKMDDWVGVLLSEWEKEYGLETSDSDISSRFYKVIKGVHEKTGRQVVILVDEYDKPLVKNLNKDEFEIFRDKLAALYSNFKTCAAHIRLMFMTGVSRFSKLSVFSGLNSLRDITFANEYADVCGITEEEMLSNFKGGILDLAEENGITYEEACARLKRNYDGYRFAVKGSDIYNPWSLLNCLGSRDITNYWNMTGIPTLIAETLFKIDADLEECFNCIRSKKELLGLDLTSADPTALLYQTGYITIKDYDPEYDEFTLGIPNREVEEGLMDVLLPIYVPMRHRTAGRVVADLIGAVRRGLPEKLMERLQTYFASIPYDLHIDNENNFQNAFYILASLLELGAEAEVHTSDGRIDLVLKSNKFIFLIELKYDATARQAIDQIRDKQYALKYANDPRQTIKIGANFSSKTRRIQDWLIE